MNAASDLYLVDSNSSATTGVDEKTLTIMAKDGRLARFSFDSNQEMMAFAINVLAEGNKAAAVWNIPTTPSSAALAAAHAADALVGTFDGLQLDPVDASSDSSGSGTVTVAPPSEAESSFDSYEGEGGALTQEVDMNGWAQILAMQSDNAAASPAAKAVTSSPVVKAVTRSTRTRRAAY